MRGTGPIIITGAAGLVGQNLVARLVAEGDGNLVCVDKSPANLATLKRLHPDVMAIEADLAKPGTWRDAFSGGAALVLNHAQIGGLRWDEFEANNITATKLVLEAASLHRIPYIVHISSSVVNSMAKDLYSETKREQEALVTAQPIPHAILRPTLMFGWFDRKHLGWLRRFMDRTPLFPIPGDGRFVRQPLYVGDLCAIISACLQKRMTGAYNISGREQIDYGDMIRLIRDTSGARARIVHIPYSLFWILLKLYSWFDRNPPFTTSQLEALVLPETFEVIDWPAIFGVRATPLQDAFRETFLDRRFADVVLEF